MHASGQTNVDMLQDCGDMLGRGLTLGSLHSGKSATIRESNHGSGVCKAH